MIFICKTITAATAAVCTAEQYNNRPIDVSSAAGATKNPVLRRTKKSCSTVMINDKAVSLDKIIVQ